MQVVRKFNCDFFDVCTNCEIVGSIWKQPFGPSWEAMTPDGKLFVTTSKEMAAHFIACEFEDHAAQLILESHECPA